MEQMTAHNRKLGDARMAMAALDYGQKGALCVHTLTELFASPGFQAAVMIGFEQPSREFAEAREGFRQLRDRITELFRLEAP